jgi:hypothetical protein
MSVQDAATEIEKLKNVIKGSQAKMHAQSQMLAEQIEQMTMFRTNLTLLQQAYNEQHAFLQAANKEVEKLNEELKLAKIDNDTLHKSLAAKAEPVVEKKGKSEAA